MGEKIVLIGGTGGGKSARALEIARSRSEFPERVFIATATPFDDEMKEKIRIHKLERGDDFTTVEEPLRLAEALAEFSGNPQCCAVVDCLTVWLCNLFVEREDSQVREMTEQFAAQFEKFSGLLIVVTNETGMGVVPSGRQTRSHMAGLATLNKRIVSSSNEAYLLVAGVSLKIK